MNRKIEEMANDYYEAMLKARGTLGSMNEGAPKWYAKELYAKGYRKASQDGAECPTCHGMGRIGTTDWLTKNISKEQLAKEKAKAVAEHEAQFKRNVAREIIDALKASSSYCVAECNGMEIYGTKTYTIKATKLDEILKKYESEGGE